VTSNLNTTILDELVIYSKEKLALGLDRFVQDNQLIAMFEPIFDFNQMDVLGYEGFAPIELTRAAKVCALELQGEYLSRRIVLESFAKAKLSGKIFLHVSLDFLSHSEVKSGETLKYLNEYGLVPSQVVVKLNNSQDASEFKLLIGAANQYRKMGFQIAVTTLNQGFTGVRMWSEIRPDYVQLDKEFVRDIHQDKVKLHIARSIYDVALHSGAKLIAEGISSHDDLMAIRDLGVVIGQGPYLGKRDISPVYKLANEVINVLRRIELPRENVLQNRATVSKILKYIQPVSLMTTNEIVFNLFESDVALHAIPVVVDGYPVGLISRGNMINNYVRPFRRDLYGRKSCEVMMDRAPILVEHGISLQELSDLILNSDPRHLSSGFIITDNGQYLGMGNGHDLLRLISNMQSNAARYANPLTLLPGNTPICEHIDYLINSRSPFVTCYFDLDNFKPFNDFYGFQKGDEVIKLTGRLLSEICGKYDFIGHIGGDDFIVLFQSADWEKRCNTLLAEVADAFTQFYSEDDKRCGGITMEDRQGRQIFYPILTISIASILVTPDKFTSHHEVSESCISAKKQAKKMSGNSLFVDRRGPQVIKRSSLEALVN